MSVFGLHLPMNGHDPSDQAWVNTILQILDESLSTQVRGYFFRSCSSNTFRHDCRGSLIIRVDILFVAAIAG